MTITNCMAIKATLDAMIAAQQSVLMGRTIKVYKDTDGSSVEYSPASLADINKQIQILSAQYAACIGTTHSARVYRPLTPFF